MLTWLQIALNGSALQADNEGALAAKVSAHGSNRAKLKSGQARFRGVRLLADGGSGVYVLSVQSVSRKVAVKEGTMQVKVGWVGGKLKRRWSRAFRFV